MVEKRGRGEWSPICKKLTDFNNMEVTKLFPQRCGKGRGKVEFLHNVE